MTTQWYIISPMSLDLSARFDIIVVTDKLSWEEKSLRKPASIVLIVAICVVALSGCRASTLSGKYTIVSMSGGGIDLDIIALESLSMGSDAFYIEFFDDGNADFVLRGNSNTGTYERDGDKLKLIVYGEPMLATIDGNKITLNLDTQTAVFEKHST